MSPRPADPKLRSNVVTAARDLFLARGFAATGIEEICAAAGVTKGALFHHWRGKEALALEVLDDWTRAGMQAYAAAPFLNAPTAVQRVLGYVDFTLELVRHAPLGCLIGTFAQEVSVSHPALRGRCARAFGEWSVGLAQMLEAARRESRAARRFDSRSVAEHFVAVFEGAQLLAKTAGDRAAVEASLGHFRTYLECLLGLPGSRRPSIAEAGLPRGLGGSRKETGMKSAPKARSAAKKAAPAKAEEPAFEPVTAAFAKDKQVDLGRMFGSPGLKVKGKVFAMLVKGRLVIKLPKKRVDALVASGAGDYFDPGHGKLMKEWAAVPSANRAWVELAKEAYAYVKGDR